MQPDQDDKISKQNKIMHLILTYTYLQYLLNYLVHIHYLTTIYYQNIKIIMLCEFCD